MVALKGIIPALTTPFCEDQSLDLPGFRRLLDTVIEDGVHGVLAGGCTGESWALDEAETAALFACAAEHVAGRVPVVAGCGAMLTHQAIAQVRMAEEAGCDAAMIQPPWYVMPGEDEVYGYYKDILAATGLPVMIYNNPRRTGINLGVDLLDKLADEPKVVALKESSKDWLHLSALIRRLKDRINVLAGYADVLGLAAITEGAVGFVEASPPIVGPDYTRFFDAAMAGDLAVARPLQANFAKLNQGLFGIGTFPAAAKTALDMLGRPGGRVRDPIRPLDAAQTRQVRDVLVSMGLLVGEARAAE